MLRMYLQEGLDRIFSGKIKIKIDVLLNIKSRGSYLSIELMEVNSELIQIKNKTMKTLQTVIFTIILSIAASAAMGQSTEAYEAGQDSIEVTQTINKSVLFDRFEKGLLVNLNSEVRGIVESALFNAVNYKVAYPEFDSERVEDELYEVAVNGDNHMLRYKAYLALAYYKNQDQFDSPETLTAILKGQSKDNIFFYLQEKIQSDQYTSTF